MLYPKNRKFLIILILIVLSISGCSNIHVGGSGKIGGVSGSGGVNIPMPK